MTPLSDLETKRLKQAQSVLRAEANGLEDVAKDLVLMPNAAAYSRAVDLILKTETYLIVVGVGKSGHIGQKLAASFASTGTPAFFLHPTEASHGDLGMIREGCTLLAISSSGESKELVDVLRFAKKQAIPVIGMTRNANSTLGRYSNVVLRLPNSAEACPNGLAPTTSTTNTLGLGDALFVSVMTEKGFTREAFGLHHPGGKLGLQLQSVSDWLEGHRAPVKTVPETADMKTVIMAISEGGVGSVAVLDNTGAFSGLITDGDLRRAMDADFFSKSAGDIMTRDPYTPTIDMKIKAVIDVFTTRRIGTAYIVDKGRPVGVIDMKSLLAEGYVST